MDNAQLKPEQPTHSAEILLPLYGFGSDVDWLELSESNFIIKYDFEKWKDLLPEEGSIRDHLRLFKPHYVTLIRTSIPYGSFEVAPDGSVQVLQMPLSAESLLLPERFVTALRLFKPGSFRRGGTWLLGTEIVTGQMDSEPLPQVTKFVWEIHAAPSGLHLGSLIGHDTISYELNQSELPGLQKFRELLENAFEKLKEFPIFGLATHYYNESYEAKDLEYQLIDLFISLESLLLQELDELRFRLAVRSANLLGGDDTDRKRIYQDIKDFYDVRCKLVHGNILSRKYKERLGDIGKLRELVRRALLSSMSLAIEVGFGPEFYKLFDEMSLDEATRKEVQQKASKLLHCT